MPLDSNRIAIVADWLIDFWWAELVLSHLLEMFPEADIFTSVCYMDHPMLEWRRVYTSWLQRVPFLNRRHKLAGILRPFAFRSFDFSGYDLVICSCSAESKQVAMGKWNRWFKKNDDKKPNGGSGVKHCLNDDENLRTIEQSEQKWVWFTPETFGTFSHESIEKSINTFGHKSIERKPKVIVYCHTPIRYYWSHYEEYRNMMEFGWLNPLVRFTLDMLVDWLRELDYEAAQKVDYFIANSKTTSERIKKYYNRESEVIYPWVNAVETISSWEKWDYYLGVSRCIPYKKMDLLVDAFNANGKKLTLCTSTDTLLYRELRAKSEPNIEWRFGISNEEKNSLMTGARAFLFPPEEDFGLVPIEAMMCGTPVIAYGKWGATETVTEWETGIFFTPQTPEALCEAIDWFEKMEWNPEFIRKHAEEFSKEKFQEKINNL